MNPSSGAGTIVDFVVRIETSTEMLIGESRNTVSMIPAASGKVDGTINSWETAATCTAVFTSTVCNSLDDDYLVTVTFAAPAVKARWIIYQLPVVTILNSTDDSVHATVTSMIKFDSHGFYLFKYAEGDTTVFNTLEIKSLRWTPVGSN